MNARTVQETSKCYVQAGKRSDPSLAKFVSSLQKFGSRY